jgi:hypothetical protein
MSDEQIDAVAQYLRETLHAGKRLTLWPETAKATKKKWILLATGALAAAEKVVTK